MRTLLAVMVALWPLYGISQGVVDFSNGGVNPLLNGLTGQPLERGSTFQVALYFAPDGTLDESQFIQVGGVVNIGPFAGHFSGGGREVATSQPGGFAMFQVRAWETSFGSTYEQAVANPDPQNGRLALAGKTGIMRVDTELPWAGVPTSLSGGPPSVVAVTGTPLRDGFTLYVVPEPATLFLILAGAFGMLLFRRFR